MSFSSLPTEIQSLLFLTFLFIYLVTLLGNSLIILVTLADPMLHSPMYFFLRNLSFLEIGFNLVIVPKMLGTLIAQDTTISFLGCASSSVQHADSSCCRVLALGHTGFSSCSLQA